MDKSRTVPYHNTGKSPTTIIFTILYHNIALISPLPQHSIDNSPSSTIMTIPLPLQHWNVTYLHSIDNSTTSTSLTILLPPQDWQVSYLYNIDKSPTSKALIMLLPQYSINIFPSLIQTPPPPHQCQPPLSTTNYLFLYHCELVKAILLCMALIKLLPHSPTYNTYSLYMLQGLSLIVSL